MINSPDKRDLRFKINVYYLKHMGKCQHGNYIIQNIITNSNNLISECMVIERCDYCGYERKRYITYEEMIKITGEKK